MKCAEVENLIVDYLDGSIDSNMASEIEKHLEGCESCLDMFNDTRQLLNLMDEKKVIKPDDNLRINFYHMLHREIGGKDHQGISEKNEKRTGFYKLTRFRAAAGIALLTGGMIMGVVFGSFLTRSDKSDETARLSNEINELRKTAMFSLLRDESSSSRIQAVNYITEIPDPDRKMIDAMISTLNNDENVNVRLTAAFALSKFGSDQAVRDSLVNSLSRQKDPIIQVSLINILVDLREQKARLPIQEILSDEKTMDVVKSVAQSGIRTLI